MTTTESSHNTTKTFKFSFPTCTNEEILYNLEVPVTIPHAGSTRELVQRVISMFHIPVYLEDELNEKLAQFVAEETKSFHNNRDEKLIDQLKNNEIDVESLVKGWERQFKDNVMEYAEHTGTSDEEVFAAAYHKLVHSPALETILQMEDSYARTVANTLKNRDEDIKKLTNTQTEEMEENVRLLNTFTTEEDINALAARHFEEQSVARGRWGSQLDALCRAQRAHHRAWLMTALQHYQTSSELATPTNSPLATFSPASLPEWAPAPRLEESFTIHLGSQLKQTHNIRIMVLDVMDLCSNGDHPVEASRRLQTALSLYSSELSGCVLLCSEPPPASALLAAAAASTDHHFPTAEAQLQHIADLVKEPVEQRNAARAESGGSRRRRDLQSGDVFVTRHSNLPDVHVVFHLRVDEHELKSDITSRHPAILGLRNVLKAACSAHVTALAIPLLLTHHITEEMTAAWCLRRAELVLKCVKGFMLEAAAWWGGAELRTLTCLLPRHTAPACFQALAALTPNVFRTNTPRKIKPSAS